MLREYPAGVGTVNEPCHPHGPGADVPGPDVTSSDHGTAFFLGSMGLTERWLGLRVIPPDIPASRPAIFLALLGPSWRGWAYGSSRPKCPVPGPRISWAPRA